MSAEWFAKKQEQLRLMGKHPVPGTKAKAVSRGEGGDMVSKKPMVTKAKKKVMDRGSKMIMFSMAEKIAQKFRNKDQGASKKDELDAGAEKHVKEVSHEQEKETVDSDAEKKEEEVAQPKSWDEVVAAAGGLLVVSTDNLSDRSADDEVQADHLELSDDNGIDEEVPADQVEGNGTKKKKTPLEYRTEKPKRMAGDTISNSNKKMFKESWNTDKARFEKRQVKYNKPQNFLLILEDNIHQAGQEQSAKTAGKLMVYDKGAIKENFLKYGIKYDPLKYVMHANAHNFEVEEVGDQEIDDGEVKKKKKAKNSKKTKKAKKDDKNENEVEEVGDQESDDGEVKKKKKKAKKAKKAEKNSLIFNMNTVANKVMCPGTYELCRYILKHG